MTLTKKWLLKTIAELEEERDAVPGAVNEDAARALAAMKLALASLEAEAVGYFGRFDADDEDLIDQCSPNISGAFPLYAAPPALASVPDELSREEYRRRFMEENDFDNTFRGGWNACRAAMLQSAEQTNYRAIVERIAEIIHGKVTDIDLLTVTVKSMKDKLQK